MRIVILALGSFFLTVCAVSQATAQVSLQCVVPAIVPGPSTPPFPGSAEEIARLRQAPRGAKRVGKRQLVVNWTAGKRTFKNDPHTEELGDVWWAYCGFSSELSLHLIWHATSNQIFTGVMLDEKTGSLLPAGEAVLFSPDHRFYLAYEQPDGQDGETLKLYKRSGEMIWKGFDFIATADNKSVIVPAENMRNMRWDSRNRPEATLHLDGGRTMTVTLMRDEHGKLEWLPRVPAH